MKRAARLASAITIRPGCASCPIAFATRRACIHSLICHKTSLKQSSPNSSSTGQDNSPSGMQRGWQAHSKSGQAAPRVRTLPLPAHAEAAVNAPAAAQSARCSKSPQTLLECPTAHAFIRHISDGTGLKQLSSTGQDSPPSNVQRGWQAQMREGQVPPCPPTPH